MMKLCNTLMRKMSSNLFCHLLNKHVCLVLGIKLMVNTARSLMMQNRPANS